jgi:hypothetical protein
MGDVHIATGSIPNRADIFKQRLTNAIVPPLPNSDVDNTPTAWLSHHIDPVAFSEPRFKEAPPLILIRQGRESSFGTRNMQGLRIRYIPHEPNTTATIEIGLRAAVV